MTQIHNKRVHPTPLNDYLCSIFTTHQDTNRHKELFNIIFTHSDTIDTQFPLTLNAYRTNLRY